MRKNVLLMIVLLISGTIFAQNKGKLTATTTPPNTLKGYSDSKNIKLLYTYKSQFSVEETMTRIEQTLKTMEIPVFARFDHGKNAEEVGLELRPNQVIVFGSPKVGTILMQKNPSISIELPLRISVWEDRDGSVWASFPKMKQMAANYGLENEPITEKMQTLLENIVIKSANGLY